ncbi:MAG: DNA-3-methyladenine glycosylase I [Betaproteobacteria bacterium]|nr:DNA-3-methyladenine glycosylase I [Betaproteobacteria bacterium]
MADPTRCAWAQKNAQLGAYHDREWGVPLYDSRKLFELLLLEGAQAGLSWDTILAKREGYRRAFDCFDPEKMARYRPAKLKALMADAGIVRNRLKIEAAVANARAYLDLRAAGTDLSRLLWSFVDGVPIDNARKRTDQVPVTTPISDAISKELKRRGFRFVGSTTMYAFMQAAGLVNDHLTSCFRYAETGGRETGGGASPLRAHPASSAGGARARP